MTTPSFEWVTEQIPAAGPDDTWDDIGIRILPPQIWYSRHVLPGGLWRALARDRKSRRQFYPRRRTRMAGK